MQFSIEQNRVKYNRMKLKKKGRKWQNRMQQKREGKNLNGIWMEQNGTERTRETKTE